LKVLEITGAGGSFDSLFLFLKGSPDYRLFLLLAGRPKKGNFRVFERAFLGCGKFLFLLAFVFSQCLIVFLSGSRWSVASVGLLFVVEDACSAVHCSELEGREKERERE
jgi:hypothetical protein